MNKPFHFIVNLPYPYACYSAQKGRYDRLRECSGPFQGTLIPKYAAFHQQRGTPPAAWYAGTGKQSY